MPTPLGHALAGVAAAWGADLIPGGRHWRAAAPVASFFQRVGAGLTMTCAGLAVLPDLDLAFRAHRSASHSLAAVLLVTMIAATVTKWVTRWPTWRVARVALMCGAAYSTHLVLDWLAVDRYLPRGLQLFWPLSDQWYLSELDLFPRTERSQPLSLASARINVIAMAWEAAILLPLLAVLWLVRVKALTGLPTEMSSGDHAP
jgi:membrane-bound metal-dependent hydrolase YbcI (DUF457 family)